MDPKRLGKFIADRRKELGLTQAQLSKKLYVTDKAVSRWERGIGLPDINNIESLAAALDVSLLELMQAQRNDACNISTNEAEMLLLDTIRLSNTHNKPIKYIGNVVLIAFSVIALMTLCVLISDWKIAIFSAGSIIAGLIALSIPIWHITIRQSSGTAVSAISSLGFALLSLTIQFIDIADELHTHDITAIEDTIDGLIIVVLVFTGVTLILNFIMSVFPTRKRPFLKS